MRIVLDENTPRGVRRILTGMPVEKAANRAAMSNVDSLDYFIEYARSQRDYR